MFSRKRFGPLFIEGCRLWRGVGSVGREKQLSKKSVRTRILTRVLPAATIVISSRPLSVRRVMAEFCAFAGRFSFESPVSARTGRRQVYHRLLPSIDARHRWGRWLLSRRHHTTAVTFGTVARWNTNGVVVDDDRPETSRRRRRVITLRTACPRTSRLPSRWTHCRSIGRRRFARNRLHVSRTRLRQPVTVAGERLWLGAAGN